MLSDARVWKSYFSLACWFPSRFLLTGCIQERPEGWRWAEGTYSSLFPYSSCQWYFTKAHHSGRDGWLQSLAISYQLAFAEPASLCPFSGIGTSWTVVHFRSLGASSMEHILWGPEVLVSSGSTRQRHGFQLCGPEPCRRSSCIAVCSASWFHYDPAVQGYSMICGR